MSYKILLVDDDQEFRDEFRDALEGDYEVVVAKDGIDALEILNKPHTIDAIVLDVMMPGMRGTELLTEIKKIAPDLGIIMLTGHSSESVAIAALKGHADDFIEKPLDVEKFKGTLAQLLRAKNCEPELDACDLKDKIERVKRFAERNIDKKVSLEDAAASVALSPKYLSRVFKQEAGMGFAEYRAEVKVREAKKLLETTGYNINQIADKLAYQNVESFIRVFQKSVGCTPSAYRKKVRGDTTTE
jgi:two-component system, response regulator YesN